MSDDLITSLLALADARHDDLSIAVDAVIEIERLRAENDELYRAAGRTRAALSGWILASPDRVYEPTHALVAAVVAEVERLREALCWYADPRNHFPVERRSPGDPDPALVVIEEPPIMSDGGERARYALEGKP